MYSLESKQSAAITGVPHGMASRVGKPNPREEGQTRRSAELYNIGSDPSSTYPVNTILSARLRSRARLLRPFACFPFPAMTNVALDDLLNNANASIMSL